MRKLKLEELGRVSTEEYKNIEKIPVVVVLDNIRSMHNVGAVFRTADAFLIEKVYLCGITATPPHKEIHKTAIGATESVDWEYEENALNLIEKLRKDNYSIVCIEQVENSISFPEYEVDPSRKYAIVMGNEVDGVQQEIIDKTDVCLEIPQSGTKHSLNVSVCTGIVLWKWYEAFLQK
ncbi:MULTISPECIES: RNA methyltransferase [Weeksella]|mgnify:CR=1 FL=1|uniref:tRNA/rRNA methyltransferase (SpoU) n=1 Tax=Weeksella virosa (strain ATCC 43766 / DSM 16922 / JCM 21250 / CCUG 30538 / CDC 9751 / IAM 14551 / NBRC 16016 / NCTC 11634 / CL345/78) TaxID=865938 RepID=F0NYN7_WEEVC|nr:MULTISPECIES: RNA methyltransferase [Weeksella]ADX68168.1 tRNA/rRNA methyltransferase (SpoU) [Weeksella virosa DSM 16922]MDK7374848.1 RNA methyltransferase [Weeksella virosa]MDK7675509.1 RNA methyltransferase [Weeksella virosa]OFM83953.1 RNA methyltransferase [Weeksella sp. HMSC059D05]SUP54479.1 tRNA (guanosine(18)-2'-O)-methyltransferase [Weeksella virosa]